MVWTPSIGCVPAARMSVAAANSCAWSNGLPFCMLCSSCSKLAPSFPDSSAKEIASHGLPVSWATPGTLT